MKRFLSLLVASALLAGGVVAQNGLETKPSGNGFVQVPPSAPLSAPAGKFGCTKPSFDFGEVSQGEEVSHDYPVENSGKGDLEIISVHGSCGCTHSAAEKTRLAPGEKTVINAKLNTTASRARPRITITVTTNDTTAPTSSLSLTGRVAQPVRPSVTELNFGTLRKGTAVPPKTFEVLISGAQSITDAKTDHEQVKVEYAPIPADEKKQGYKLTVSLDGLLPVGQLRSNISLTTTVPAQKTVTIPVLALVEGEITRQAPDVEPRAR